MHLCKIDMMRKTDGSSRQKTKRFMIVTIAIFSLFFFFCAVSECVVACRPRRALNHLIEENLTDFPTERLFNESPCAHNNLPTLIILYARVQSC